MRSPICRSLVIGLLLIAPALATPAAARAQAPAPASTVAAPMPAQYLGVDIIGFLGFFRLHAGSFQVHYERILGRHHGLQLAGDFVHIHQAKDYTQSHQWTFGGSLSYRYYFGDGVGPFLGVRVGYRRGFGHFEQPASGNGHIDLVNQQVRALGMIGYRLWWPAAHLGIVSRLGLGYGPWSVDPRDRTDEAAREAARISRDNLGTLPLAVELELSIAYGF